jgi:aspartyl protease family protein
LSAQPPSEHAGRPFGRGMLVIFWVLALGMLTLVFGNLEDRQYNPNQALAGKQTEALREVVLERNRFNHYVASGLINGVPVTFMLDTGASAVVVPKNLAAKLGLVPGRPHIAQTANGQVQVRATRINKLQLGPIELLNINASINPGMNGEEILLGMSALKQIEFSQKGKMLTLRQYR